MKYIVEEKLVSFKTFEQKVFDHVCELGREMTRIIPERYDDELAEERDRKSANDYLKYNICEKKLHKK